MSSAWEELKREAGRIQAFMEARKAGQGGGLGDYYRKVFLWESGVVISVR
jgi:hypothetical protein